MIPLATLPCQVTYSVAAPGWEAEISQAVGTISLLSGITFTLSDDAALHFVERDDLPVNGVHALAWSLPGEIAVSPTEGYETFQPKQRRAIVMHELMHQLGIGHNSEPDSIMNVAVDVYRLSLRDAARIGAAGARCVAS